MAWEAGRLGLTICALASRYYCWHPANDWTPEMAERAPVEGPWTRAAVIVAVIIGALALWQTFSIFQLSELGADIRSTGGDVRATNTRIDQIFPLITQQATDIGSIKGDLRAATDKITAAADRSAELSNRLSGMVDKQDAQVRNIQEIQGSLAKLVGAVDEQHGELIKIENKIGAQPSPFPLKKTELEEGYVFTSPAFAEAFVDKRNDLGAKEVATVDFGNPATFANFAKFAAEKPEAFKDMFFVTKDAAAALALQKILGVK